MQGKACVGFEKAQIESVIGILAEERTKTQRLEVDVCITWAPNFFVAIKDINDCVDYAKLLSLTRQVLQEGKFDLLERAALEIVRSIYRLSGVTGEMLESIFVRIEKPQALPSARATVSLTLFQDELASIFSSI